MPNTPAPEGPLSVVVTKPGHDTVRVGPFTEPWRARGFAHTLDRGVRGAGAPAGTRLDVAAYDPDLFTRLVADRGWEHAARAWLEARTHRTPAPDGIPDQREPSER